MSCARNLIGIRRDAFHLSLEAENAGGPLMEMGVCCLQYIKARHRHPLPQTASTVIVDYAIGRKGRYWSGRKDHAVLVGSVLDRYRFCTSFRGEPPVGCG
ncbi:hypothetical protein GGTG_09060 [Gaeumannomyces tritici R3-111a-1]|uniref:Uncharacterized protein n=1 Tax=Gaeumannomyces tritici (strain R3-111a-1) TaxID=644352 RepID=J3P6B9_GAET3|nr:hypothetical protein GGTG_09060 [Gaeumannomyces tritici R3-111a-1]EJT72193.1 hypothetical protein GGTG_09060 [Gaeumannomyces tritici R3-111a-1]